MWIDVQQNTQEWFDLRLGKITSSNFSKIMANDPKVFGKPAIEYAQKVALEIVTGQRDETSNFKNAYMDRGHELEPIAIHLYELETFRKVTNGGFNDCGRYGDSPDSNIGKDGCLEIKSVIPNIQWNRIKKGGIDTSHKWQIHGHIWLGKKEWCDFVSYCPEMPESKQLHIYRVHRDEDMINSLKIRTKEFLKEVDKNITLLKRETP